MTNPTDLTIEEWDLQHPRWAELLELVRQLDQNDWFTFTAEWHTSSHVLVALRRSTIAGFLRFVCQEIGPDTNCPAVQFQGQTLQEAKVLAFGVLPLHRRHGIGRALQEALRQRARALGCYQIRSHSSGDNSENHQLKLSLGYGVLPILRGEDRRGVYFILPLRQEKEK